LGGSLARQSVDDQDDNGKAGHMVGSLADLILVHNSRAKQRLRGQRPTGVKRIFAVAGLIAALTACSSEDKARARVEAARAKADLKQGARQTAAGLQKAGAAVDKGAKHLKDKVDKELNTPDRSSDTRER
jgi:hypothetical protein